MRREKFCALDGLTRELAMLFFVEIRAKSHRSCSIMECLCLLILGKEGGGVK